MGQDHRRRTLLTAALGFLQLPPSARERELRVLHAWLDNWKGLGHIVVGIERLGYRVSVRNIAVDSGWVATFSRDPMTSNDGFGGGEGGEDTGAPGERRSAGRGRQRAREVRVVGDVVERGGPHTPFYRTTKSPRARSRADG